MTFYRPYASPQHLSFWGVAKRDFLVMTWLMSSDARFKAFLCLKNRWFVFKRLEIYLDGWDNYSWGTPKFGYPYWQFMTVPEENKRGRHYSEF